MSRLYLVSTPIGNLEDITFRAVRILKEVPLIAAEDTRTSKTLLNHYQIDTPLTSYHEHNKDQKTPVLMEHLKELDLALISDAGTPAINDPGYVLVKAAIDDGHQVVPIPGPSAPITALSASGISADNFLYLGYIPKKKKQRQDLLGDFTNSPWTLIFLESPHRLVSALEALESILGDRQIAVARELTKLHEEIFRGSLQEAKSHFSKSVTKGEITLIISGTQGPVIWTRDQLISILEEKLKSDPDSPTKIAKSLVETSGWSRRDIYDLMQDLRNK